jgi:hypothetical protein
MSPRIISSDEPFDPSCPFDAMAESFRLQIIEIFIKAECVTIFRELSSNDQLASFISGALTAIVVIAFAGIKPEARDIIMTGLADALPFARKQAESIEA